MKKVIISLLVLFTAYYQVHGCTTAIISGKYTADGRPLLYKQRDTPNLHNTLSYLADGKYPYVALLNSDDTEYKSVFGGYNTTGFAIMNSASYNINPERDPDEENPVRGQDGKIMKLALQYCASLEDFEAMLDSLPKPLGSSSNFGVIDATGGAAYYETNNEGYVKYDVNDSKIAPLGYIIRTNFSYSGDRERDKGLSRYHVASNLLYKASLAGSISYQYLLDHVSRNLTHGITGTNLYEYPTDKEEVSRFVAFRDYVPRYLTASAIVVQGVKENESPALTTMWTILGSPLTAPIIPILYSESVQLPTVLTADENGEAKLCEWSLEVKKQLFPIGRGEGPDYLDVKALLSSDDSGILQRLRSVEKQLLNETEPELFRWREQGKVDSKELNQLYKQIDKYIQTTYYSEFFQDYTGKNQ